ncbi:MAG TPA: phosphomannose isomerase type II C-terminal cupin domain [Candidatus Omnitrophota bacterium]|nr:phosphomannose isomerase type II C-terminal cupin domain [Candidatus Omnitrophota bacterium]HPD85164.1 phosphomannose isomerase type II C-terminal cupin domain [Candidatus Omnitrophota bacterium]HRZ04335.1 phosphomannose isomerase type II C-terminal cupin domain [Candidatus Omnitrophota bacterium]
MTARASKKYTIRPWGKYKVLFYEPGVWVKRVEVKSQSRISLQKHFKRSEKWIVVRGKGIAIVDGRKTSLKPGVIVDIPRGAIHRIANTDKDVLLFIEVACGRYLGEDDIKRFEDDYFRIR